MTKTVREHDLRVKGMGLGPRFMLSMTVALAIVMGLAAIVLYQGTMTIAQRLLTDTISEAVVLSHEDPPYEVGSATARQHRSGVQRTAITYGSEHRPGTIYYLPDVANRENPVPVHKILVPGDLRLGRDMLGIIAGILLVVVLVGAGMAMLVAKQVTRPIHEIIEDVRHIARGELAHRTRAVGAGEIELLARSIDRMTRDLEEAQDAEVALSIREREMEFATGVREALLPLATPVVAGYDLGSAHLGSPDIGGDFHCFVELEDGRVGLLVCDVSGQGVPAALVGATARSYLRSELARGEDPGAAFRRINRWLGEDVRRGMFVTALYVLIDPAAATATAICAGHKVPLVRYTAADGKVRLVHPEGIALGFDKGPVFDQRLEVQSMPLAEGDRLVLCNSAPVRLVNPEGRELGEKAFYARILKHAPLDSAHFLKALRRDILQFVGEDEVPYDVSLVTISRTARS
ncbi:MAG: SpoIIE family protein phosphatase [Planctomycetota bacterium]